MLLHQKLLTGLLILLSGMLLGVLLMITRGSWLPPERVEVRYTDISRSTHPPDTSGDRFPDSVSHAFTDIADMVIPAVVYIETELDMQQALPDDELHNFENQFWDRFLPRRRAQSIGSGVMISSDGYILTNHHVIDGAGERIRVITHDRKDYRGRVVGTDPSTDLAVIKIEATDATPIVIGNSDYVRIGDWVMAVGNPFRLRSTVTAGIVSATGRDVDIITDRMRIESFIQTDAAINRGNSGGALVNTRGELVGINTAIASESGTYQGYGFAVPVNMAMKIGQDMIEFGTVQRAFLGVEIASIDHQQALSAGLEHVTGVEVRSLVPGGSADNGGLKKGDVILSVNGYPVDAANRLQERIAMMRPGDEVALTLWRDQQSTKVQFPLMGMDDPAIHEWATAATAPPPRMEFDNDSETAVPQETFDAGFTLAELVGFEELSTLELVVIHVESGRAADRAGLQQEDVVTRIGNQTPDTLQDFVRLWQAEAERGEVTLHVRRGPEEIAIVIHL
ncbi:MAG: trypsin-like peptidase domain-containing protein [Cyclonatronaceae bacterium]